MALLSDMWGLEAILTEISQALRMIIVSPSAATRVQAVLKMINVPQQLMCLANSSPSHAVTMQAETIEQMLLSSIDCPCPTERTLAADILHQRGLNGIDDFECLSKLLGAFCRSHWYWWGVSKTECQDQLECAKWICSLLESQVVKFPERFDEVCGMLQLDNISWPGHSFRLLARTPPPLGRPPPPPRSPPFDLDGLTTPHFQVPEELLHTLSQKMLALFDVGAELVRAGRLSSDYFAKAVLQSNRTDLSGQTVDALPDGQQCALVKKMQKDASWFTIERLIALRGKPRSLMARKLAANLAVLDRAVCEFVYTELCCVASSWPEAEESQNANDVDVTNADEFAPAVGDATPISPNQQQTRNSVLGTDHFTPLERANQQAESANIPEAAKQDENSQLAGAILRSKSDVPPTGIPLSGDGVVIIRLTRRVGSPEVLKILTESTVLSTCHQRVTEAGCEFLPEWSSGATLLVPITHGKTLGRNRI